MTGVALNKIKMPVVVGHIMVLIGIFDFILAGFKVINHDIDLITYWFNILFSIIMISIGGFLRVRAELQSSKELILWLTPSILAIGGSLITILIFK